jgi:hypothetical protein
VNVIVADFTEAERELVAEILQQRYLKPLLPEPADSELKLDPASDEMTSCPTLYWSARGAHFVVCKVPEGHFRCQFFYADADHYGTGQDEYTDLRHCVLTLLRVQADHEAQSAGISSGATGAALAAGRDDDEYFGPVVI